MEVGRDHGGLEPRKLKSEEGGFLATRSSEWKRTGESHVEAIAGKDAGNKYVRERERVSAKPPMLVAMGRSERAREGGNSRHYAQIVDAKACSRSSKRYVFSPWL